ncbi:hypothetical protein [Granulicatella elegans]|uniref:sodium:solute symporter family transporter n=1 Tax=Granulicatella elegans TaxID=137732 RepID=UPI0028D41D4F|nr:hypothetical protein [Granulicatella elegans]
MNKNRTYNWVLYSLSIFATLLSPISFIGIVDTAYHTGYRNYIAQFGILLALPILYWVLKQIMDYEDVFHFIGQRFGHGSFLFSKGLWTLYQLLRIGIVLYIPSVMLEQLTNISAYFWILLLALWAYGVARGGLLAVVRYDSLYAVILFLSMIVIAFKMMTNGILNQAAPSQRDSFSTWILFGASFQTFSSYLVSPDIQERFQKVGNAKLLKSILLNATLGILFIGVLYVIGVSLKQSGYQFNGIILLEYAKSEGLWIAIPVMIGVLLSAQTTLSTGYEILEKQYASKYSLPIIFGLNIVISSSLVALGGVSSYEFFVGYVGIFLSIISSLVLVGLIFSNFGKSISQYVILCMCISLGIIRVFFQMEMWIYGLVPLVSGLCSAWILIKLKQKA